MDEHAADPGATRIPTRRPERLPSHAERRGETAHMVTVLSDALATQIGRLAASAHPAPDGWWFGLEHR